MRLKISCKGCIIELLILKALAVVSIVLGLTVVAEKVSPKVSGVLSGLPVGSSITLLFFAVEMGTDYVQRVALYNIHGLFAALSFCIGYYISTFYKGKLEIIISIVISFIFYLIIAYIISFIPPHIVLTPLIVIILIVSAAVYFEKKENFAIVKADKVSLLDLSIRIGLTIGIFLFITSLPKSLPENLAGIFSSFPSVLLPLLLIVHFNHSNLQARTIIKNTPMGLSSVAIYSLIVYFTYPILGILYGTLISLCVAVFYLFVQTKLLRLFKLIN
jgi:hypothetical protein